MWFGFQFRRMGRRGMDMDNRIDDDGMKVSLYVMPRFKICSYVSITARWRVLDGWNVTATKIALSLLISSRIFRRGVVGCKLCGVPWPVGLQRH